MNTYVIIFAAIFALTSGQNNNYDHEQRRPHPAILNHKQALSQDGSFQYSFAADNGLQQGESISPDGSRKGSYSYVDPNGKTITVTYTADKNGFHVQGDHLPKPVQPVVPPAAPAPQQQYQGYQPQYQAAPQTHNYQQQPQQQTGFNYERPNFGGFGPAQFPAAPAPVRQASYAAPRPAYAPTHSTATYTPRQSQQVEDYDEAPQDPNKPHDFGAGYSFAFAG